MTSTDTIAAQATPSGRGGVGIIRISGPRCKAIAEQLLGEIPAPRYAKFTSFTDDTGEVLDEGLVLFFPAPNSFTGEDVIELQGHGGPVIIDMLLQRIYRLGARPARPGEFSERAFLNDKIDLAQAEAIADLIDAGSKQAAKSAMRSLQGEFSNIVNSLADGLMELRLYVEAAIDFPEEEIDFLADQRLLDNLSSLENGLAAIMRVAEQGVLLKEGMQIVLAGRPNAGKSSLLNTLAGREAAIVTAVPGTTRDIVREEIHIDGMPIHIIDTAGLRESDDIVEQEGIKRTHRMIEHADQVLVIMDDNQPESVDMNILDELPKDIPVTLIHNKIDISGRTATAVEKEGQTEIFLSAKTGDGLEYLRDHLKTSAGFKGNSEGLFIARRRHLEALNTTERHLKSARVHLEESRAGELLAEDLRLAQQALGEITGAVSSDDLLGEIFSSFCIGK